MQWFNKIGNLLDDIDGPGQESPSSPSRPTAVHGDSLSPGSEADAEGAGGRKALGSALMGKGLGFLSNAASKASSAVEAANNAVEAAGSAVDSLGSHATARIATALREINDEATTGAVASAETSLDSNSSISRLTVDLPGKDISACSSATVDAEENLACSSATMSQLSVEAEMAKATQAPLPGAERDDLMRESQTSQPSVAEVLGMPQPTCVEAATLVPKLLDVANAADVASNASQDVDAQSSSREDSVLEQWQIKDPAMSLQSLPLSSPSGIRSPTPSLGAASITTSGAGTSEYIRVGEVPAVPPNMELMDASSEASQLPTLPRVHSQNSLLSSQSASNHGRCDFTDVQPAQLNFDPEPAAAIPRQLSSSHGSSSPSGSPPGEARESSADSSAPSDGTLGELQPAAPASSAEFEAQLQSARQQIERLQAHIVEVESECSHRSAELKRVRDQEAAAQAAAEKADVEMKEMAARLAGAEKASQTLQQQVEGLKKELELAQQRANAQAKADADRSKDAIIDEVREEMEKELQKMLRMKDEQVHALERKVAEADRLRREQQREIDRRDGELKAARLEAEELRRTGEGKEGDLKRELDDLNSEHQQRVEAMTQMKGEEERMKHELALSLRGVEERARTEIAQLEAQRGQLELHAASLQEQLEAEKRKCTELAISLGEATQSAAGVDFVADEAQAAAEEEVRALRDRLRGSEERLADARSAKDIIAEEMETVRNELKALHVERSRLENELRTSQATVRELQASLRSKEARDEQDAPQQAIVQAMQKDFDDRMERHKDEVGYLRQKCDEKERRCEQLLAERSTLASELKAFRESGEAHSSSRDADAGKSSLPSGAMGRTSAITRSLPMSAPSWLRSSDEPLRMVVRVLANSPPARMIFFGYVILLHFWVLFILQNAAMQGAAMDTSSSSSPTRLTASSAAAAGSAGSAASGAASFLGKASTS